MARRRRKMLQLPAQAGKDIKAVTNILDRWAIGIEDVMKDTFEWVKKHKFLVIIVTGLVLAWRYWFTEPIEGDSDEDEE